MNIQNMTAGSCCQQAPPAVPPTLSGWGAGNQQTPSAAVSPAGSGWDWGNRQGAAAQYPAAAGSVFPQAVTQDYPQQGNAESMQYLNGFLRMQIGSRIKAEFLVGTNTYLEKSGKLLAVGANYIVLQEAMTDDMLVCDFFNIKFVTVYR